MLIIDGEKFKVDVLSCKRTADFLDKHAKRTENGDLKRELIGVYFNYKLTIAPGIDARSIPGFGTRSPSRRSSTRSRSRARTETIPLRRISQTSEMNCSCSEEKPITGKG